VSKKREVWKFPIGYADIQTLDLPFGARILHFDKQGEAEYGDQLWIWAEVDPKECCHEPHTFYLVGTGHPMRVGLTHVGTVLTSGGRLVWHLYEAA